MRGSTSEPEPFAAARKLGMSDQRHRACEHQEIESSGANADGVPPVVSDKHQRSGDTERDEIASQLRQITLPCWSEPTKAKLVDDIQHDIENEETDNQSPVMGA